MKNIPDEGTTDHGGRLAPREGNAILAVMLVIVILTISAIPMMEIARQTQIRAMKQQLVSLLNKEAKEYLEIGIYSVQLADGIPDGFTLTQSAKVRELAQICEKRVQVIDPDLLGTSGLTDNTTVYSSDVTLASSRWVGQFIVDKSFKLDPSRTTNDRKRYAVVSCATSEDGELGVYGAEIASLRQSYFTISFGKF